MLSQGTQKDEEKWCIVLQRRNTKYLDQDACNDAVDALDASAPEMSSYLDCPSHSCT